MDIRHSSGSAAELFVASYFAALGHTVAFPFTAQSRYDLIVDDSETIARIQVKKATLSNNGKYDYLQARLSGKNKQTNTPYKPGDFEYFAFTDMQKIWVVPFTEVGHLTSVCLGSTNPSYKPQTKYEMAKWQVEIH